MAGDVNAYEAFDYQIFPIYISTSEATSNAVDLGNWTFLGIQMPTSWSVYSGVTNNATMTFQVATSFNGTYYNLYDDSGIEVAITNATNSRCYSMDAAALKLMPWKFMKIRAGNAAAPATQAAARTLYILRK